MSSFLVGRRLGIHGRERELGLSLTGRGQEQLRTGCHPGPFLSVCPPSFVTTNCALQFSSRGIRPGLTTVLARNLDKNTVGYLQWRWGIQSAMNTSVVRDTKTSHFTVALQVRAERLPRVPPTSLTLATLPRSEHRGGPEGLVLRTHAQGVEMLF